MNQHQTTLAGPPRVKGVLKVVTTEEATLCECACQSDVQLSRMPPTKENRRNGASSSTERRGRKLTP